MKPSPSMISGNTPEDQWLRSLLQQDATVKGAPLVSLPNLQILQHPEPAGSQVNPYYQSQPAPMGLADFGLGTSGPYSYNTTHINAQITFNSAPFAFAPGSESVINPDGQNQGYVGSPQEFSIQLNTVTNNYTIPGSTDGSFWTQNVLDMNATGIHFVDDVFNLTGPVTQFQLGSIASGCGLTDLTDMLTEYGGVYQCVGTTIPISSLGFPLTISLYNNATVNAAHQDVVSFGYRFSSPTSAFAAVTGWSDNITFVNPTPSSPPALHAGYSIDGYSATPSGLLRDAEIIFGGPIGGANAVFSALSASMNLYYSNVSSGGWKSVPSAYDFGTDTGETSTGIAGYWTTSGTEQVNQGPSFLYGLWGGLKWASVASGSIQFAGSITPTYGFVFVSNVAPGGWGANLTIVPTTPSGTFDSYLPPAVPPGTQYYVRSFGDGYQMENTTPFSTSQASYTIALNVSASTLNAPLYADGGTQESALSSALGLSPAGDYNGLTVDLNLSFNHLNDYSFPSFGVYLGMGVTGVTVNNTVQGPDSPLGTIYYYDNSGPVVSSGFLQPGPFLNLTDRPQFSLQIDAIESGFLTVSNETFQGYSAYGTPFGSGGGGFFWAVGFASAEHIVTENGSYGFFIGDSELSGASDVQALSGANGVDGVGGIGLGFYNISASGTGSFGVYLLATDLPSATYINASDGASGVYAGGYSVAPYYAAFGVNNAAVQKVNATTDATGAVMIDSENSEVAWVNASSGAIGVESNFTSGDTYLDVTAQGALGVLIIGDFADTIRNLDINDASTAVGAVDELSFGDTFYNTVVNGAKTGVLIEAGFLESMDYVWDNAASSSGVTVYLSEDTEIDHLQVNASGTLGVNLTDDEAFVGDGSSTAGPMTYSVTGGAGITLTYGEDATSTGTSATGLAACAGCYGIELVDWSVATITDSSAANSSVAVLLGEYATSVTVTGTTATNGSLGVEMLSYTAHDSVLDTTVTDNSTGVFLIESGPDTISGLTDTNSAPFSIVSSVPGNFYGPIAAIVSEYSGQISITNVVATNIPWGLYDEFSGHGTVVPGSLTVDGLNLTGGYEAVYLDVTWYAILTDIGAYQDWQGVAVYDGEDNLITDSQFVDDTSYGVSLTVSSGNIVAGNTFIGDNGATDTFSAAHIQGFASPGYNNYWYDPNTDSGNYWADWHQDPNGYLAPYVITTDLRNVDRYPLGVPFGETAVWFYAYGLASGVSWSVTFDGMSQTTTAPWLLFGVAPGSYSFTVGAVAGYVASPAGGSVGVPVGTSYSEVDIYYTAVYNVTLTETGLPAGASWSAIVGGTLASSTTSSISVSVPGGSTAYQIPAIAGYTASPSSGTILVAGTYNLSIVFTQVTYAVTVSESGLSAGTSWSATVNGVTQSTVGSSVTFYLPNGTYLFQVANVSGYSMTGGSGTVHVNGSPAGVAAAFTPNSSPSVVSSNTYNTGFAILIAIAVIALLIGLLALFWRRRGKSSDAPAPPAPWTPPAGGSASPSGGGSETWSEGSGNPPA
jgi:parallel beta-helix repeat protein